VGRELAARLGDALWSEPLSNAQRISILQDYLLLRRARAAAAPGRHRRARHRRHRRRARHAARRGLAQQLGVSRQHLALQFRRQVGISPSCLRASAASAPPAGRKPHQQPDWAQVALQYGYFDQSHLIHDFQDFARSSPEAWLTGRRA
jgi:AraC-like DNA-binding protein